MKKQGYKITYEKENDVLNIWLSDEEIDSANQTGDVIIQRTKGDKLVCIKILSAVKFLKEQAKSLPKEVKESVFA